jgi:hypothetical protein
MRHILSVFGIARATDHMDEGLVSPGLSTETASAEALARPLFSAASDLRCWAEEIAEAGFPGHARYARRTAEGLDRTARALLNGERKRGLF